MINLKHVGSDNDSLKDQFLINLDNMIGKGSYGKVYLAYNCEDYQNKQLNNPICAKEIPRGLISDKIVKSIRNEAQIQMSSKSPKVLKMYSFKQTKSNVYFFLEYCPDGDLKQLIYNSNLTENVGGLYQIITSGTINFPKEVNVSEELKELINLMLEVDEEGRLDWDDIINKELIKKSQLDQTIKGQIQQIALNNRQKILNEQKEKQQQLMALKQQQQKCKSNEQQQQQQESDNQTQLKKAGSNVENVNSDEDEDIFESSNDYQQENISLKIQDDTPQIWKIIQMHRAVYKQIQANLQESSEKFNFLICIKHEEFLLCKKYIALAEKQKNKLDSNIYDQIQYLIQDIQKGNQYKELQHNLQQLINITKQNVIINKENYLSVLQNTYLKYKQKELETIKTKNEQEQHFTLLLLSKIKFIAYHDYEYRGSYKNSNLDELQTNQLFNYIIV
ncbi:hypothetical protein ABPG72_004057 [Tetrahymena utriculariae]